MDNVGCHGTETRLTDCAYHRDTSEDSHSGDIWIECDTTSKPEPEDKTETDQKDDDPKSDGIQTEQRVVSEKGSDVGLIVALVALIISIVVTIVLVGCVLYKKQEHIREKIRFVRAFINGCQYFTKEPVNREPDTLHTTVTCAHKL